MRQLIYDCYTNGIKITTKSSWDQAVKWKEEDPRRNSIKERLIPMEEKEKTEAKVKRLERIAKRQACLK